MSHDATNWANKVRGISCAEARVLWHLADCHNPVFGCYPKQEYLADACEIDVRSVRRCLDSLRSKGHINWVEQREGKNRKANRYSLACEQGFRAHDVPAGTENQPGNMSGSNSASTGQEQRFEPDKSDALNRTPESSIEPVREPVIEPVKEEEGARDAFEGEDERKLLVRVKALEIGKNGKPWPGAAARSTTSALREFTALSPEYRRLAEDRRDAYLAYCERQKVSPLWLASYLKEHKFLDIDAVMPKGGEPATARQVDVAPFGPIWAGKRYWIFLNGPDAVDIPLDLRATVTGTFETFRRSSETTARHFLTRKGIALDTAGKLVFPEDFELAEQRRRTMEGGYPEVNRLHEQARSRARAMTDARFAALGDLCEAVKVTDPLFAQWLSLDERMGWPAIPDPGSMPVVYFPRGGPQELGAFERVARELLDGRTEAAE
ncbi:helix-turn-helix domain-containing protein [Shinella sp.]|jgi:hypothetical protein|uniref:helix-turn-helix domain-containing protein n=1 Tax=Shinella sp. TaxID=1870904 RepID=UPI003F71BF1F